MTVSIVDFLRSPAAYGLPEDTAIAVIETHGAWVFLAGEMAYKLKKPVAFPYMNYSTVERRAAMCAREVLLNRLTAPEIYEAAVPVTRGNKGDLALNGQGAIVDWLVVMHRFRSEDILDAVAERGELTPAMTMAVADAVLAFHAKAQVHSSINWFQVVLDTIAGNDGQFENYTDILPRKDTLELTAACRAEAEKHADLLRRRAAMGAVRQCHGDIHLRNICWWKGKPLLFDCIEFNDAFAQIDVLYDTAFLLMDLQARGLGEHAALAQDRYVAELDDVAGLAVLPLYLTLRAAIRAHVSVSIGRGIGGEGGDVFYAEARRYLALAQQYLQPVAPRLVAIGGLSGSGKSTLAKHLAGKIAPLPGAVVLRTDILRKQLAGKLETDRLEAEYYNHAFTHKVYTALRERAEAILLSGRSVILDCVAADAAERAAFAITARTAHAQFIGLWCEVDDATARQRLQERTAHGRDASDADVSVRAMQEKFDCGDIAWARVNTGEESAVHAAIMTALM
ncbi:MAG: AAA family ATPase [Holosporales bacterium]|jgi:aminoglycoside phosphotransferase family enzyme/predicted kinase